MVVECLLQDLLGLALPGQPNRVERREKNRRGDWLKSVPCCFYAVDSEKIHPNSGSIV